MSFAPLENNIAASDPKGKSAHSFIRSDLPSTERLLLEGGDARIALGTDGTNKYGCTPFPDATLFAFGSSTASSISEKGFEAADTLRQRLLASSKTEATHLVYAREINRIRQDLMALCDMDAVPGIDVMFAASGTDLHLLAAQLVGAIDSTPTLVIMVDPEETGRGVPLAVAGRHFNAHAALGELVDEGEPITDSAAIEVATVPIRLANGMPKAAADIDAEVESLANMAVMRGQKVFLILADVTKTGMIAPSIACATTLSQYPSGVVQVMVDACQFRLAKTTLHAYLQRGFMVAVTGSKFLTGPTFAGALFLPAASTKRLRDQTLPRALTAYSSHADWPAGWVATNALNHAANFGLLLRWEAALEELRAFRTVPERDIDSFLQEFALAVRHYFDNNAAFASLAVPQIDRRSLTQAASWDQLTTIFPFLLYRSTHPERTPLNREQTMAVYRLLQSDLTERSDLDFIALDDNLATLRCQVGQPVACGQREGVPVSALRLCISARHIVEACAQNGAAAVIARALRVLEKAAMLTAHIK